MNESRNRTVSGIPTDRHSIRMPSYWSRRNRIISEKTVRLLDTDHLMGDPINSIPLRSLFAVHPELLAPVLQIIHRAIATFLFKQTGQKRDQAATDAITLIQRFGSAANLNIQLRRQVLDGVLAPNAKLRRAVLPSPQKN